MIHTVVVDIEGTTSPTDYVLTTLFPYARARFAAYLDAHGTDARVVQLLDEVHNAIGSSRESVADVVAQLEAWTDADAKVAPLKTLQGWIWQEGFARGELVAPCFPDVIPALRAWHARGLRLAVFSSGSVDAQRAWFGHTAEGDLGELFDAHFDTVNAGPKRAAPSYERIASALAVEPGALLFLSDVGAELDAAAAAGWHTVGVVRAGEPAAATGVGGHRAITSFAELDVQ